MNRKKKSKLIAFLPLRKGSRGIPHKNTKLLLDKELFRWVLDCILNTALFDEIWIATNDELVERIITELYTNQVKLYHREECNAQDVSPTIDVVMEFLEKKNISDDSKIVLFQATSPFTSENDIFKFVESIKSSNHDSAIACYRMKKFVWSEQGKCLSYNPKNKPRRQDVTGMLIESGAIYSSKVSFLRLTNQLISNQCTIVEISESAMIDIDESMDWVIAEAYALELKSNGKFK